MPKYFILIQVGNSIYQLHEFEIRGDAARFYRAAIKSGTYDDVRWLIKDIDEPKP